MGAPSECEITAEDNALVSSCTAGINAKCNHAHEGLKIVKASSQVVAGTNKFYHLEDNKGEKLTATIHVPLPHTNAPPEVQQVSEGHQPLQLGHGA